MLDTTDGSGAGIDRPENLGEAVRPPGTELVLYRPSGHLAGRAADAALSAEVQRARRTTRLALYAMCGSLVLVAVDPGFFLVTCLLLMVGLVFAARANRMVRTLNETREEDAAFMAPGTVQIGPFLQRTGDSVVEFVRKATTRAAQAEPPPFPIEFDPIRLCLLYQHHVIPAQSILRMKLHENNTALGAFGKAAVKGVAKWIGVGDGIGASPLLAIRTVELRFLLDSVEMPRLAVPLLPEPTHVKSRAYLQTMHQAEELMAKVEVVLHRRQPMQRDVGVVTEGMPHNVPPR
jgi:hypothetical protein